MVYIIDILFRFNGWYTLIPMPGLGCYKVPLSDILTDS